MIAPLSARVSTAPLMLSSPLNRMPKPMAMLPMFLELRKLTNMISTMPITRATGASVLGRNSCSQTAAEESMSSRRMIWPVTVVPTLAPTTTPSDWCSDNIPAATRPEVMTMVAVEDWISAVTARPRKKARTGPPVSFSIATFSVPEELSFRLSPIRRMP